MKTVRTLGKIFAGFLKSSIDLWIFASGENFNEGDGGVVAAAGIVGDVDEDIGLEGKGSVVAKYW